MVSEKVIKLLDEYVRCCLDDEYTLDARAALIAAIAELGDMHADMQRHRDQWRRYAYKGGERPSDYLNEAPSSSPEETMVERLTAALAQAEAALRGLLSCRSVDILEDAAREYPHGKEDVADIVAAFDRARAVLAAPASPERTP